MAHARVAIFTFKSGTAKEAIDKAEREILPLFQKAPGFISYTLAESGGDTAISFSMWDSKRQAEEANRVTSEWVQKNLSRILVSVDRHIGEVAFSFPPIHVHVPAD